MVYPSLYLYSNGMSLDLYVKNGTVESRYIRTENFPLREIGAWKKSTL